MIISGTTVLMVNGTANTFKATRVCGRVFNAALRNGLRRSDVRLPTGEIVAPSKGLSWGDVAKLIRAGKKVQAACIALTPDMVRESVAA